MWLLLQLDKENLGSGRNAIRGRHGECLVGKGFTTIEG